jgi:hypothetical protein
MLKIFAATTIVAYLMTVGTAWASCTRPAEQLANKDPSEQKALMVAALFCGSKPDENEALQRNGFWRGDADFLTFVVLLRAQANAEQQKLER